MYVCPSSVFTYFSVSTACIPTTAIQPFSKSFTRYGNPASILTESIFCPGSVRVSPFLFPADQTKSAPLLFTLFSKYGTNGFESVEKTRCFIEVGV